LASCSNGPREEKLKELLQARLNQGFGEGAFQLLELERMGHYPFSVEGDARDHLLIYYNAELKFSQDHKLSDWDKLNVGSLISILGATPNGVKGLSAEGNRKGDTLVLHGSMSFAEEGEAWVPAAQLSSSKGKTGPANPANDVKLPYREQLELLASLGSDFRKSGADKELLQFTGELKSLVASAERRRAHVRGEITLGTGSLGGEYHRQGSSLAKLMKGKMVAFATKGSMENCRLVEKRELLFAYTQNDIAWQAYNGNGRFEGEVPHRRLRALASLYPEALQVVTLASSSIKSLADLKGKRLEIGPQGSGSRANALELLRVLNLSIRDLTSSHDHALGEAISRLGSGDVDALIFTSAYPNPLLTRLAEQKGINFLPLAEETISALQSRYPFLLPLKLPKNAYPGLDTPSPTVGVTAMLITHENSSREQVKSLLETLFSNVDQLSKGSLQAYFISKDTARSGLSLPLHPAAEAFYAR